MKTKVVGSISEFLNPKPVKSHWEKYGFAYKVVGTTVIILVAGASFDYAFASSGIEDGAQRLYDKLLSVGKWVIIFKGGFDIIKFTAAGDFEGAKKGLLSYLLIYIFLFGLPWAMDEIDAIFKDLTPTRS
jgi:hypothetical protein